MGIELDGITYMEEALPSFDAVRLLPDPLQNLLRQCNGFVAWDGALHVFGVGDVPEWHDLTKIAPVLRAGYPEIMSADWPFAQDSVGDLFFLRGESVWKLSAETAETERRFDSLEAFFDAVADDPDRILETQPLRRHLADAGTLAPGTLLSVYPPFCTPQSADGYSMRPISASERRRFLIDFAAQMRRFRG